MVYRVLRLLLLPLPSPAWAPSCWPGCPAVSPRARLALAMGRLEGQQPVQRGLEGSVHLSPDLACITGLFCLGWGWEEGC